jgi:hypothetical protein
MVSETFCTRVHVKRSQAPEFIVSGSRKLSAPEFMAEWPLEFLFGRMGPKNFLQRVHGRMVSFYQEFMAEWSRNFHHGVHEMSPRNFFLLGVHGRMVLAFCTIGS